MKKSYLILSLLFFIQWSQSQTINIPDANFKNYLLTTIIIDTDNDFFWDSSIDINNDGEIQESEALLMSGMNLNDLSITSLEGIQYFTNLERLQCTDHRISSLDLSQNVNLELLDLRGYGHHLTYLDISQCINLKKIDISNNYSFANLDVTQNVSLEELDFSSCEITQIDVTQNPNLERLDCSRNTLVGLDVSQNPNLEELDCAFCSLPTLNVTQNLNLIDLDATGNTYNSLDVTQNTGLKSLRVGNNQNIPVVDVSQNVNLTSLDYSGESFTSIDLSANVNLVSLRMDDSQLTTVDLSTNVNLKLLYAFDGSFTSLDVSQNVNLERLMLYFNDLTSLDISNNVKLTEINLYENMLTSLDASNNPLLTKIGCASNELEYINIKNGINSSPSQFSFVGNPNLQYLCADEGEVDFLSTNQLLSSTVVGTYCSVLPGGVYHTLEGNAILDTNLNGCDVNDNGFPNLKYNITRGSNLVSETMIANSSGDYRIYLSSNDAYAIAPELENPAYFTVFPDHIYITVDTSTGPNSTTQDFCITPNGTHNDVEVTLIPLELARPGFDASYQIMYENKGNTTLSGTVQLTFDDDVLDLVTANPMSDTQAVNTLTWNYTNLEPFETRTISFTMNINSPTEVPAVNNGDILNFEAMISSGLTDETPDDNVMTLQQTVVNSFDPNDIRCLEGETVTTDYIDKYVYYMIRFENTGTASAVNVVVTDVIDVTKFDVNTLTPVTSSHSMITNIKNTNEVEFIFENINLPFDDATNDGYLVFKIKTLASLQENDTFANTANIFFDFNAPIVTNTATTLISNSLSISENNLATANITIYPNPVKETIEITTNQFIEQIEIVTIDGKLVHREILNIGKYSHKQDVSFLVSGIYLMRIITREGTLIRKIVKQ